MTTHPARAQDTGPSPAERARTAVAGASVGTLVVRGKRRGRTMTSVTVECSGDGSPVVWLDSGSPVLRELAGCCAVALYLSGPTPYASLHLAGSLERHRERRSGRLAFRMRLRSVDLVGPGWVNVPLPEFRSATPDPLRDQAAELIAHLEEDHRDDLLAGVRSLGHHVEAVVPRAIDRYGIEVAAICPHGVTSLRLRTTRGLC